jgi:hypothetical protein
MNISFSPAVSLYVHLVLSEEEPTNARSNTIRELLSFKPSSFKIRESVTKNATPSTKFYRNTCTASASLRNELHICVCAVLVLQGDTVYAGFGLATGLHEELNLGSVRSSEHLQQAYHVRLFNAL